MMSANREALASSLVVNPVVSLARHGSAGVITVDSPPVNALSHAVRDGLHRAMALAAADAEILAIVIMCEGRTFFAGADITEFGKPPQAPSLKDVQAVIEASRKPVVAAIHGSALGGGLELALVAHHRVATRSATLGLPEVNLGLLPGAGGTQRLPRIVGVERALDMLISGDPVGADAALALGLVDRVVAGGDLRNAAIAFAEEVVTAGSATVCVRDRPVILPEAGDAVAIIDKVRQANRRRRPGFHAPEKIIQCVEAALRLPFDQAMEFERARFNELLADSQSAAMRHVFFAERQAAKAPGVTADHAALPISSVAVIGAGTMGGGIAMSLANAGIPVRLVEQNASALERGLGLIRKNYEASAAKGKLSAEAVEARMALIGGALDLEVVRDVDLVIEAVFEDLKVKQEVFARLDAIASPHAILATNTSYLDVEAIAAVTSRPERVVGLHFFSPANVMRLLEIVRTARAAPEAIATAIALSKKIGKVGVTVGNGFGFAGNRMLAARNHEADRLILEGSTPADVDRVLVEFGFPMGHFQMRDLVGLDVGWNRETTSSSTVREILNEMGRQGQKSGAGYYDYAAARTPLDSAVTAEVITQFAALQGIEQRPVSDAEIRERTLLALVNEGIRILEEGIVARSSDLDVIWVLGYGWPRYRGGPLFWAELEGLDSILERLRALEQRHGDFFKPAQLLEELVASKRSFKDVLQGSLSAGA
jgi:3-hydroxyacyl-CoA dehydrogenase